MLTPEGARGIIASSMKRIAVLAFIVLFASCLFHFYYAEEHCPVHCPTRGGEFGHVQPHPGGDSVCLCFLAVFADPGADDLPAAADAMDLVERSPEGRLLALIVEDLTPPPKSSLV